MEEHAGLYTRSVLPLDWVSFDTGAFFRYANDTSGLFWVSFACILGLFCFYSRSLLTLVHSSGVEEPTLRSHAPGTATGEGGGGGGGVGGGGGDEGGEDRLSHGNRRKDVLADAVKETHAH